MKNSIVLKLFKRAIPGGKSVDFKTINELAVMQGLLIHPDVCQADVLSYIRANTANLNATFYRAYRDVASKSRLELLYDQMRHYCSTYGTGFKGQPYIPNDDVPALMPYDKLTVIYPITEEEVEERCKDMLYSGIALSSATLTDIFELVDHSKININLVKNREAKLIIYTVTGTVPTDATEFVRYLVYRATAKSLLIKDRMTVALVKASPIAKVDNLDKLFTLFGYEKLAASFYRFKPLFLALRGNKYNRKAVNKLRRFAVKHHVPMKKGYFDEILVKRDLKDLEKHLGNITNFKKVALLELIQIRMKQLGTSVYTIRNQKLFVKMDSTGSHDQKYLTDLYVRIYQHLIESISAKACRINLPKGIQLTIPKSEKSFMGNFPLGTSIDLSKKDAIVGIHWRDADGANDLDLKMISIDGSVYGWNAAYTDSTRSVIYSGDMTSAHPEAVETFYAANGFTPSIVKVNLFSGEPGSKLKVFIARCAKLPRNTMVDPKDIVASFDTTMDSQEKTLGVITGDRFVMISLGSGHSRVSRFDKYTKPHIDYVINTMDCYLRLEEVLLDAGFVITNDNPDIDLTSLDKDTLLSLFSTVPVRHATIA